MAQKKKKKKTHATARLRDVPERLTTSTENSPLTFMAAVGRKREYPAIALTAVLCLIVFGRNITFDYLRVDLPMMVFNNPRIMTGFTWENIYWAFTQPNLALYQPLPNLTFMLDSTLFGGWPGGYHTVTLLWHIGCMSLFFWVMMRLLNNFAVVFAATLLLALHPFQIGVVSQIAPRNEIMQGIFFLLSVEAYRRYVARGSRGAYALSVIFMGLGLLCKQIIVVLPVALLLLDYWPLRRIDIEFRAPRRFLFEAVRLAVEKAPHFALSLVGAFLAVYGKLQFEQIQFHVEHLTIPDAIYFIITGYARYVGHLFYPVRISYFEVYPEIKYAWFFVLCLIVLIAITTLVVALMRRKPYLIVGWLWFVVVLFPVSGVVRYMVESIALRYLYVPAMFFSIAVCYGFYDFALWRTRAAPPDAAPEEREHTPPQWYWLTIGVVVAILAALAFWQNGFCRDTETGVYRMFKITGGRSSFGHHQLALIRLEEGKIDEAREHFEKAIEIQSVLHVYRYYYAKLLYEHGLYNDVVAVMEPAVEAVPDNSDFWDMYALGLLATGRYARSEEFFKKSLSLRPEHPATMQNLAYCHILQGHFSEAEPLIEKVLERDPANPAARELEQMVKQATGHAVN